MSGTPATVARTGPNRAALDRRRLSLDVAGAVLLMAAATGAVALALASTGLADARLVRRALVLTLGGGAVVVALAARYLESASFGAANRVTLARAAIVTLLLAMLDESPPHLAVGWVAVTLAVVGLALDGVDGALARRRSEATRFGARFDMETDALLIVALCALAWQLGKAGPWIMLAGALRYLFVAAGRAWPWLARELPPSRRRQTVCVVQIGSLIACLIPPVTPPASQAVALLGLVLLGASFAVDVAWLARGRG
jgi:phosphatidylglycerophosphate synthase